MMASDAFVFYVDDLDLAQSLRADRLLTSSLRFEPTFKHEDPDEALDEDGADASKSQKQVTITKKQRKIAQFSFEKLLPLYLTPEEALLAVDQGRIRFQLVSNVIVRCLPGRDEEERYYASFKRWDDEIRTRPRFAVFCALWARGMTMVDGLKFGVDFLAYSQDPTRFHAEYMVLAMSAEMDLTSLDLVALINVAAKARKTLLMATVTSKASGEGTSEIKFLAMHRRRVVDSHPALKKRTAVMTEEDLLEDIPG